ncbi:tail fiber/spike domain-containing protein [Klebsiella quasipneumoniae]|uniref:tail fiber/spike domain-containing protein n=1 Tax=Klebsiella quasipneumoniae TaxID=1463165 RepID=UPI001CD772FC|nr:hypothetical protein [Klebsiella quasipneumoniae]
MTRIPESPAWEDEIELISRSERVSGGLDGVANRPLKSLANRTRYLKERSDESDVTAAEKVSAVKKFTKGATLESPREEILHGVYRLVWTGDFPKTVPPNSSPETTGGVKAGGWAYTSDAKIRQSLADKSGFGMVGQVSSFAALRGINPARAGQKILLASHAYIEGWFAQALPPDGFGEFIAKSGSATDDGGYICVPDGITNLYWQRIIGKETLRPEHYGARCDSTRVVAGTDCTDALNAMFATAIANNFAVEFSAKTYSSDLLERGYYISKSVVATGINVINGNPVFHVKSSVFDQTTSKYALLLGDPNTDFSTIQNGLIFSTISVRDLDRRAGNMRGIYVKYTGAYGTFLRAIDINGVGVELAPVYDSSFIPIVERCGNVSEYALLTNPNGDECNSIFFPFILCHDSYHKGIYVAGSKIVIEHIHAEANAVLTTDDGYTGLTGATTSTGLKYVNHVIYLTGGELRNANFNDYAYADNKTYYGDQNTLNGSAGSHVAIALVESTGGNIANKIATERGGNLARTSFFSSSTESVITLLTAGYVYFESTSRIAVTKAVCNFLSSWSADTKINGGRIRNWGSRFIGKLTGVRIDTTASADDSSYVDANRCDFPNGITHISASPLNKFTNCEIPTMNLTAANSAEVGEFTNCNIGATGGVTVANGTASYIKNLTFKGCTLRNAWSSGGIYNILRFVGTDNTPAGSAYSLTGWTRPRFTAPGTIVQQPKSAYTSGDVIQAVCLTLPSDGNATWQNIAVAA